MKLQHNPQLFTTVKYEIGDNTKFTIFGFKIENGEIKIHFVQQFSRASSRAKTWKIDEIYHSTVMTRVPEDLLIPDDVLEKAKLYFAGYVANAINSHRQNPNS